MLGQAAMTLAALALALAEALYPRPAGPGTACFLTTQCTYTYAQFLVTFNVYRYRKCSCIAYSYVDIAGARARVVARAT